MKTITLKESVRRDLDAICCPKCNGYAARAACTEKEIEEFNCGKKIECCARAFVCKICGSRIVGTAEAPECC